MAKVHSREITVDGEQAQTQEDLDEMMAGVPCTCGSPNCDGEPGGIMIVSLCHPTEGVGIYYDRKSGHLKVWCALCTADLMTIEVATKTPASH